MLPLVNCKWQSKRQINKRLTVKQVKDQMLLSIRSEQMSVIETFVQEGFVRRIAEHLLANYPQALVRLPGEDVFTVDALPEETLYDLIRSGIRRARSYGFTFESSIAGFVAVMFEIAPNFDTHRLSQVLLNDEEVEPNARLDELLNVLTEKNWEAIRTDYDPQAWEFAEVEKEEPDTSEQKTGTGNLEKPPDEKPTSGDLDATVLNY